MRNGDTRPLGVLVIGAGDMGSRHAAHWAAAGARVVAVSDPDLARARASAEPVGAAVCATPDEALTSSEVEVVSVCTPTFLHARYAVQALKAGKHVLCEKPIALTLQDARAMKAAAEASGCELRIGFMRRFEPIFPKLREMIRGLGEPVMGSVTITAGVRPKRLMHDRNANGGPVIDMCCHIFDVWKLIFGAKPELLHASGRVLAEKSRALVGIKEKAVDSAAATFGFPDGHTVQLLVTWGLPEGVPFAEKHVYLSENGLVEVDWNYQSNTVSLHDGIGLTRYGGTLDPWAAEIAQFYTELTQGAKRQVASAEDGIDALELSLSILEAVEGKAE